MTPRFRRSHAAWLLAAAAAAPALAAPPAGYELFWADEFDAPSLDESSWWYRADEKQQSIQLPSNVELDSGHLVLNLTPLDTPINGFDAAGAGVITQQRFRYGYYEVRSKLGDGVNDDNDSATDEGWWHAFWAMAAEGDANGNVLTTFPDFRRTEIDGYENGSNNLTRFTQHVLPWNDQGQITAKLPSNDVSTIPVETINDWHTYGFEWTPDEVRFFVDGQPTKVAIYPESQYEHDEINVWLTAISTNGQSSDQERSEARYDYFRFYKPGDITVADGETLQIGSAADITGDSGGTITTANFGSSAPSSGGLAGDVTAQSGGTVLGAGTVWGDLAVQDGAVLTVGGNAATPQATGGIVTSEDFESFTPGVAFDSGAATGLLPAWQFFDLGANTANATFAVTAADGLAGQPSDAALTGETQMLFQTNPGIDFATEALGGEAYAGAIAVSNQFDTSGQVDRIEADFVFDGFGDPSGGFLDTKIVFGFRDVDNWFSLSLVAGEADGTSTQIDIVENKDGERNNIFGERSTGSFNGGMPRDTLLHAEIIHDSASGYVSFVITDPATGDVLAESFTINDAFKFDGLVGLAVNNDATGIDNLVVTTGIALPGAPLQTLTVDGAFDHQAGATLEIDVSSPTAHDQLLVTGAASLAGVLELTVDAGYAPTPGDTFVLLTADAGLTGTFDTITGVSLGNGWSLAVAYEANRVLAAAALTGDFNRDGVVDLLDFDTLAQNFGTSSGATWAQGDANGDGVVDLLDFDALAQNFGASAPTTVPEPASLAALAIGMAAAGRRRQPADSR